MTFKVLWEEYLMYAGPILHVSPPLQSLMRQEHCLYSQV